MLILKTKSNSNNLDFKVILHVQILTPYFLLIIEGTEAYRKRFTIFPSDSRAHPAVHTLGKQINLASRILT